MHDDFAPEFISDEFLMGFEPEEETEEVGTEEETEDEAEDADTDLGEEEGI